MKIVSSYKPSPNFKVPSQEQEESLQNAGFLVLAAERFREESRDALLITPPTRESYTKHQVLAAAWKAAERGAARAYDVAGFPASVMEFTPAENMDRYAEHLPAALEHVTSKYRASLSSVGRGGLVDASILDATRKAIQHEIEQGS